ncbi:hypothetical protein HDU98_004188 [Podochytrium sp. JEL0797]|nr:hypothetical protein HDU98_004188 [Podochytrium sp. JEL0797]
MIGSGEKYGTSAQIIDFANKQINFTVIKQKAFLHTQVNVTRNFRKVLTSPLFDQFMLAAANYIRWYVQVMHLEKLLLSYKPNLGSMASVGSSSGGGTNDDSGTPEANKRAKSIFVEDGGHTVGMEVASIYALTKEIVSQLINLPGYTAPLESELNRLFRGNLFCGTDSQDANKPGKELKKLAAVTKTLWGNTAGTGGVVGGNAAAVVVAGGGVGPIARRGSSSRPNSGSNAFSGVSMSPGDMGVGGMIITGAILGGGSGVGNSKFKSKTGLIRKLSSFAPSFKAKVDIFKNIEELSKDQVAAAVGFPGVGDAASAPESETERERSKSQVGPLPLLKSLSISSANPSKVAIKPATKKRISLSDIRMAQSPLACVILPPPQRYLFT